MALIKDHQRANWIDLVYTDYSINHAIEISPHKQKYDIRNIQNEFNFVYELS